MILLKLIFKSRILFATGMLLLIANVLQAGGKVNVNDFGAVPNDTIDDAPAIRNAVQYAKDNGLHHIVFGEGTYYIKSSVPFTGNGFRHIAFIDMDDLVVEGATDQKGEPATLLLRHNPSYTDGRSLPSILLFKDCENVIFRNFKIDNDPAYSTAGVVTDKGSDFLEVEILEGNPVLDGSPCYTANAWDLKTKNLKKVPSLTFGNSPANWQLIGDGESKKMRIEGVDFTRYLDKGDGISWQLGIYGRQIQFDHCRDLLVKNIITHNAAGFAMESINCKNVTGKDVIFKTKGNQLALGPRDAWKIAWCGGEINVDKMYVEGVRWDGQNIHGSFLYANELLSSKQLRMFKASGSAPILETGSKLGFWNGNEVELVTIADWNYEGNIGSQPTYLIDLEEDIPSFVDAGTFATVYSLNADHYTLTNSKFRNIAGCASVIKQENTMVDNCTFEYIMYPPIILGTEKSGQYWLESTFPRNVTIRNSEFDHSGWIERIGLDGNIGIGYRGDEGQYIRNITIENNEFRNGQKGINLKNCDSVYIHDNVFIDIAEPILKQESTTGYTEVDNNTISVAEIPLYNSSKIISPSLDGYLKFNLQDLVVNPNQLELESHVNSWPREVILGFEKQLSEGYNKAYVALYCKGVYDADRPETTPMYISGYASDSVLVDINWGDTTLFSAPIDTIYKNQNEIPQWYIWDVTDFINTVADQESKNFYFRIYSQTGSFQLFYFESLQSPTESYPSLVLYENDTIPQYCFENNRAIIKKVYPNPANNRVSIDYLLSKSDHAFLRIYNKNGEEVKQLLLKNSEKGLGTIEIDISGLPKGIYYCRIEANGELATYKLLKQ